MKRNASWLTKAYPSEEFWTEILFEFLDSCETSISVSEVREAAESSKRFRERRKPLIAKGQLVKELRGEALLDAIEDAIHRRIRDDVGRFTQNPANPLQKWDDAGIKPDLALLSRDRVILLENKPLDGSRLDGNQGPGKSYSRFVRWLIDLKVECEYLLIQPISVGEVRPLIDLQAELGSAFGVLLLEDVFAKMDELGFRTPKVTEPWSDYTDKSDEFSDDD